MNIKSLIELTKQADWDDDHGVIIPENQWDIVTNLIEKIGIDEIDGVLPCGDGYIHLMFNRLPLKGLLEVGLEKSFWTVYNVTAWEDVYTEELDVLDDAIPLIKEFIDGKKKNLSR